MRCLEDWFQMLCTRMHRRLGVRIPFVLFFWLLYIQNSSFHPAIVVCECVGGPGRDNLHISRLYWIMLEIWICQYRYSSNDIWIMTTKGMKLVRIVSSNSEILNVEIVFDKLWGWILNLTTSFSLRQADQLGNICCAPFYWLKTTSFLIAWWSYELKNYWLK